MPARRLGFRRRKAGHSRNGRQEMSFGCNARSNDAIRASGSLAQNAYHFVRPPNRKADEAAAHRQSWVEASSLAGLLGFPLRYCRFDFLCRIRQGWIQDFIAGGNDQKCIFHKEGLVDGSQQRFVTRDGCCLERLGDTLSHIDSKTGQRQVCKHSPAAEISQPPVWTRKSRRTIRTHGQPVRAISQEIRQQSKWRAGTSNRPCGYEKA